MEVEQGRCGEEGPRCAQALRSSAGLRSKGSVPSTLSPRALRGKQERQRGEPGSGGDINDGLTKSVHGGGENSHCEAEPDVQSNPSHEVIFFADL
jgi:hypothetical protein